MKVYIIIVIAVVTNIYCDNDLQSVVNRIVKSKNMTENQKTSLLNLEEKSIENLIDVLIAHQRNSPKGFVNYDDYIQKDILFYIKKNMLVTFPIITKKMELAKNEELVELLYIVLLLGKEKIKFFASNMINILHKHNHKEVKKAVLWNIIIGGETSFLLNFLTETDDEELMFIAMGGINAEDINEYYLFYLLVNAIEQKINFDTKWLLAKKLVFISKFKKETQQLIHHWLENEDISLKIIAIRLMSDIPMEENKITDIFINHLNHENREVQLQTMESISKVLNKCNNSEKIIILEHVSEKIDHQDMFIRIAVYNCLGNQDKSALLFVPVLEEKLKKIKDCEEEKSILFNISKITGTKYGFEPCQNKECFECNGFIETK